MTRLLVCAATQFEIDCFPDRAGVARVVTGVGIPHTLLRLPRQLAEYTPDFVLNIGIAGAYPNRKLNIGDLVWADSEVYGDIGFEQTNGTFQPIQGSPFGAGYESYPMELPLQSAELPRAAGCTVSACTGTLATGEFRRDFYNTSFETMEGAAVAQIGQVAGIPVSELRAISNIAAERDMRPENIRTALERLKAFLHQWEL